MSHFEPLLSHVPDLQNHVAIATTAESLLLFELLKEAREFREEKLARLCPLHTFFDKNRFSFTSSIAEITKRWNYNLQHFAVNYMLIVLGLAIYADYKLVIAITIAFIFGGFFLISRLDGPLTIGNTSISPSDLYPFHGGASLVLFFRSDAPDAIVWTLSVAPAIILAHAALLEPSIDSELNADSQV